MEQGVERLVDHLFRHQAGRLVSTLTRIFGPQHLDLAEEVVQDALLKAMQQWPYRGIPDNPTGWLTRVARNRALDLLRRRTTFRSKQDEIVRTFEALESDAQAASPSGDQLDDELSMIFMACHPTIPRTGRVALTLKTVGGFGVSEIARAFLTKEATIAQRIVRAKRQIRDAGIVFDLPEAAEMSSRLDSVLEVLYLLFNEGYTATSGENLVRRDLCEEAIRLCSLVVHHPATDVPKCNALLALMLLQAARLATRVDAKGDLFLLGEQDRSLWDRRLLNLGMRHLDRSIAGDELSQYHLEAAIAACHAMAPSFEATDWARIVELYEQLEATRPSPVVALNHAIALAKLQGPMAGIDAIKRIEDHPALEGYYLLPATLGDLWREAGDPRRAAVWYRRALERPCSAPEQRFLLDRLALVEDA